MISVPTVSQPNSDNSADSRPLDDAANQFRRLVENIPGLVVYMDLVQPDNPGSSIPLYISPQIEDLLGIVDPVNVPGTDREYPNWQRKLSADIEDIASSADFSAQLAEIQRARST